MFRKIKIVFILAVVFRMGIVYSMEQEQQLSLYKMPHYTVLYRIADYLSQKNIYNLVSTCRSLKNCLSHKRVFTISGSNEEIVKFLQLMQEERFSRNKIGLSLRSINNLGFLSQVPKNVIARMARLNLRDNSLRAFPEKVSQLTNLEELDLSGNRLSKGGEGAFDSLDFLSKLRVLNLEFNFLSFLPKEISQLSNLEELNLRGNNLSEERELNWLCSLSKLRVLNLQHNSLRALPKEISKLTNLEELNLAFNSLSEGGALDGLGSLSKLRILELWSNSLRAFPEVVSQLTNLEELYLRGNNLSNETVNALRTALPQAKIIA